MRRASELEAQITAELKQVLGAGTTLTGLPSRWTGKVELVSGTAYKGCKPFSCDIRIARGLADQETRWSTLIHEALHAVSIGLTTWDYKDCRGWEEGVVEMLQRVLRQRVLAQIGIRVDEAVFQREDATHIYAPYLEALEQLRTVVGMADDQFCIALLRTPLRERPGYIRSIGLKLSGKERMRFLEIVGQARMVLDRSRPTELPLEGEEDFDENDLDR
jgi:hypothetical protein